MSRSLLLGLLVITQSWCAHAHLNSKSSWPSLHHIRKLLVSQQQYTITSSVSSFTGSGQVTQITVQDSSSSSSSPRAHSSRSNHLLALYPSPSDPTHTIPFTFVNITHVSPNYPDTGTAHIPIKLLNFRSDFILRLVSNGPLQPTVLAESTVIKNTILDAPGQVHLAQHADGHSVVVQWVSASKEPQQLEYSTEKWSLGRFSSMDSAGSSLDSSTVTASQSTVKCVPSSSHTYTADMMCDTPANSFGFWDPGHLHTAVLPAGDVGYNQQLYFRVGSYSVGWSQVFSFTSAPSSSAVAANQASFTFLVFNDVGQENAVLFNNICPPYCPAGWAFEPYTTNSTKLLSHLTAEADARLGLVIGDLSYANGYAVDWDYFGFQFEPAFSKWPVMVAAGNHEMDASGAADVPGNHQSSGGECGLPYTYRYYTPAWEAGTTYSLTGQSSAVDSEVSKGRHKAAALADPAAAAALQQTMQPAGSESKQQVQHSSKGSSAHSQAAGNAAGQGQGLSTERSFYSFEMGGVHFLMLNTEAPSDPDSPQGRFVAADLAQVQRQRTPWLVVGLHRQMVGPTTDPVNIENLARLQADLEDLFLKYKVDLVLQGHDHAYARTCPYAKGHCTTKGAAPADASSRAHTTARKRRVGDQGSTVQTVYNPTAPIYILAGHAGAGFTHSFPDPLPGWVEYGVQDRNGYLRVTVTGDSLTAASVSTDDGHIMDGVEILRVKASS